MKFNEYLSSFITPQMTLLEKFNALLKYFETETEKSELFYHKIVSTYYTIEFIDTKDKIYDVDEFNLEGFFDKKLNVKINGCTLIRAVYANNSFNVLEYLTYDWLHGSMQTIALSNSSQSVEKYEG